METTTRTVPQLQAGGGNPSTSAAHQKVSTLSPTVLQHLKRIHSYGSISEHGLDGAKDAASTQSTTIAAGREGGQTSTAGDYPSFDHFLEHVTSTSFSALAPPKSADHSYPISNYFISSSHNTYLTGNQLYSDSSTGGYRDVLLRGCRCVEIDVWNGEPRSPGEQAKHTTGEEKKHRFRSHIPGLNLHSSKDAPKSGSEAASATTRSGSTGVPTPWISHSAASRAEPRVLHGYTLTKEITFREVCAAIREAAFVSSDLPVIVSLEVHTCAEQQEVMIDIMQEEWRGLLVDEPNGLSIGEDILPSPGELRGKILVKVKHSPKVAVEDKNKLAARTRSRSSSSSSNSSGEREPEGQKKKKSKIIQALSSLGIYTQACHFSNFSQPEASNPCHVFSLSEKALMDVHETQSNALFTHNRNFLMRAYPKALRVQSSNLDPAVFWRKGVQMVALNWQKWDEGMMLNEGMFAGEGGWVLKPPGYRSTVDPRDRYPVKGTSLSSQADAIRHKTMTLRIEVFAGQATPLPPGDNDEKGFHPYVKCEVHVEKPSERTGAPIEGGGRSIDGEYKRRTKTRKGIEPDYGGELLEFVGIPGVVEELSFVRFKIHDDEIGKDDLAAWACIRLDRLQEGYRFVHLLDAKGRETSGVLLVKIIKSLV
ncbi:MAG: hypothetical protein M1836_001472 [Candelina mexicana]|nr:MAG: hypothetical protein M1836_001472 [Candelina mexicana]